MNDNKIPQRASSVDDYIDEANQVWLKAMRGHEGDYRRYEDNRNIADVVASAVNDNKR